MTIPQNDNDDAADTGDDEKLSAQWRRSYTSNKVSCFLTKKTNALSLRQTKKVVDDDNDDVKT